MVVNKHFILVHIDKKKQLAKKEKMGNIFIPPAYEYMLYNLQHGTIAQIGKKAGALFPEAEVGDLALFHHTVEHKPLRLAKVALNGDEYRLAHITDQDMNNQVYGVIKKDGRLIPMKPYLFIEPAINVFRKRPVSNSLLIGKAANIDEEMWDDDERLKLKLADNKKRIEELDKTMWYEPDEKKKDDINRVLFALEMETEELSIFMQKPKLASATAAFIHPEVSKTTGVVSGDPVIVQKELLIPFGIDQRLFFITYMDYVDGKLN